ncbi:TonB family protein [Phenylobacterium sp. J426]|uniref:TonB family protein n=1 Tax=Phenylobacterium sp. J426 TaxID=2898439 RepID=UPI0027E23A35|nr:TonB family protein [Phenylobacterium sp. J426]
MRRTSLLSAALVLASAGSDVAVAQMAASRWSMLPSSEDLLAAYPAKASDGGVEGIATLSCAADAAGRLSSCTIVSEEPADAGFGAAALSLIPKFRWNVEAHGVGNALLLPIRFKLPERPRDVVFGDPTRWSHLGPPGPYFPDNAYRAGVGGVAIIDCLVGKARALDACRSVEEAPGGFAFSSAALRMAERRYIKAGPDAPEGPGRVAFRVVFPKPPPMRPPVRVR